MKAALLGIVTIVLLAGVVWSRAQTPTDRPPGVDPERWIPITDSVGIVLMSTRHNGQWLAFDELGSTEARLHPAL
jgi:hypothetical protein